MSERYKSIGSIQLFLFAFALWLGPVINFSPNMTWHDRQRIEQVILLCALTLGSLFVWHAGVRGMWFGIPRWIKLSWSFGLGVGLLSAFRSEFPRYAALEWASLMLLGWAAVTLGAQSRREGAVFDRWAIRIVALAASFILIKTMANYFDILSWDVSFDIGKLFSLSFSNPRFFGQAASMMLPILAFPLISGRLSWLKAGGLFLLLAALWMLAIASGSRGTWLAMLVAGGMLAMVSWHASQRWLKVQLAASMVGLCLFAAFFLWLPEVTASHGVIVENRLKNVTSLSGREVIWTIAWQQVQHHPWLGIGPMHLAAIKNPVAAHPHNALLQLGAEWGLPATIALIAPFVYAVVVLLLRIRNQYGNDKNPLLVCLAASLLAAATQSMVDGVIVMPYTQTLLVFVCGWALGLYFREYERDELLDTSRVGQIAICLVPAVALGLIAWGVFPEIVNRVEITRQLIESGVTFFHPRYWAQGWIP